MYVLYLCGSSDLSDTINVIYLANANHHLSCIAALHRRLYVQWVHTRYLCHLQLSLNAENKHHDLAQAPVWQFSNG